MVPRRHVFYTDSPTPVCTACISTGRAPPLPALPGALGFQEQVDLRSTFSASAVGRVLATGGIARSPVQEQARSRQIPKPLRSAPSVFPAHGDAHARGRCQRATDPWYPQSPCCSQPCSESCQEEVPQPGAQRSSAARLGVSGAVPGQTPSCVTSRVGGFFSKMLSKKCRRCMVDILC